MVFPNDEGQTIMMRDKICHSPYLLPIAIEANVVNQNVNQLTEPLELLVTRRVLLYVGRLPGAAFNPAWSVKRKEPKALVPQIQWRVHIWGGEMASLRDRSPAVLSVLTIWHTRPTFGIRLPSSLTCAE